MDDYDFMESIKNPSSDNGSVKLEAEEEEVKHKVNAKVKKEVN